MLTSCSQSVHICPATPADRPWIRALLIERWGSVTILTRERLIDASALAALVARRGRQPVGLATFEQDRDCQLVTLDSLEPRQGIGRKLVEAVAAQARGRLWLITTNDNLEALAFYLRSGFRLVAVHREAVTANRHLKPEIPLVGAHGIAIEDEWEFEYTAV
ncbi:MAG: GNAT family N-acetyltransferase [Candidatus Eremiobacteraeota bacterium]|nr:GNAT family N-acetyltransferase [Candidatus Eremiobacteraeota bacterium]